jgi:hypothetical protein
VLSDDEPELPDDESLLPDDGAGVTEAGGGAGLAVVAVVVSCWVAVVLACIWFSAGHGDTAPGSDRKRCSFRLTRRCR